MKRYIFQSGTYIESENLNAESIKKYEVILGELVGVLTDGAYELVSRRFSQFDKFWKEQDKKDEAKLQWL